MFGFGMPELIILLVILVVPAIWIISLVDVIKSDFPGNNKIIWLLAVIFVPLLGSILYLTIGRGQKITSPLLQTLPCSCGAFVPSDMSFCSKCGEKLA
jgi:hypothetical protein